MKISCNKKNFKELDTFLISCSFDEKPIFNNLTVIVDESVFNYKLLELHERYYIVSY